MSFRVRNLIFPRRLRCQRRTPFIAEPSAQPRDLRTACGAHGLSADTMAKGRGYL
jgi:hypothetical protein